MLTPTSNPNDSGVNQAEQALRAGHHDAAEHILRSVLQSNPAQAKAHELMGMLWLQRGDMPQAEQHLQKAVVPPEGSAFAHYLLGSLHLSQTRYAAATTHLRQCILMRQPFFEVLHNLGTALMHEGLWAEALDCFNQATALKNHPEAWHSRGLVLQSMSRHDEAVNSFNNTIALQIQHPKAWGDLAKSLFIKGQHELARKAFAQALPLAETPEEKANIQYSLACLSGEAAPAHAPASYVANLFDQCAGSFDQILVGQLAYNAPEILFDAVSAERQGSGWRILDLGCGTGLCGQIFEAKAARLDGVDLSAGMLDKARKLGLYSTLVQADITTFLAQTDQSYDLIIAADVFIYVGRLDEVMAGIKQRLVKHGLVCFSIEVLDEAFGDIKLRTTGRYAHAAAYIQSLAEQLGLVIRQSLAKPVRTENGQPVPGMYFVMEKLHA